MRDVDAIFLKTKPVGPTAFEYESAGLEWLRAAGEDAAHVVPVIQVSATRLTLRRLDYAATTEAAAVDFGRRLARTHDAGAEAFGSPPEGWEGDGWIGILPMPLVPEPTWGLFYARHRCRPFLERARERGTVGPPQLKVLEQVLARIEAGVFDDQAPPARLHGDLWSGNLIPTSNGFTLIDPAAHGGHRITDLAMLCLFGAPRLESILRGYEAETTQLPRDWRRLVPLHQLHPLLVHAAIFEDEGYAVRAAAGARQYL